MFTYHTKVKIIKLDEITVTSELPLSRQEVESHSLRAAKRVFDFDDIEMGAVTADSPVGLVHPRYYKTIMPSIA